jgi:hypothetical protein
VCCVVVYCTVVYSTVVLCCVLYCCVLYCCVHYCCVLYCCVLYCCVLCCYVLYCCVLHCCVLYWHFIYFDVLMSIMYKRHDHFNTSYYGMGDVENGGIWGASATLPAIYRRNGAARRQTRGSRASQMHVLPNWRPDRSLFYLLSEIHVSGNETNVSGLLHKQTCPVNTLLYGHTIPPLNCRAQESYSSRFPGTDPLLWILNEFCHGEPQNLVRMPNVPDFPKS